ncbi:uncharacterized protein LOC144325095 isoform X3 [Podarcis muralis]
MALSGVNQSHVQPVWVEIPSRSADIGAQVMPIGHLLSETISRLICNIDLNTFIRAQSLPSNLSALPAQNLLADPVNSRQLPNQDTQEEMDIFTKAALLVNVLLSIYL